MHKIRIVLLAFIALIQPAAYSAVTGLVVDIPTRPGVTVRILYNAPDSPTAHLILFAGNFGNGPYDGYFGIELDGSMFNAPPDVYQSINSWIARGVSFTVVDPPIGRQSLDAVFRRSAEHTADILAVVRYLQQRTPVPVWLMGLGSGAISAASVTSGLGRNVPLGAILGTPHTVGGNALTAADLARVYSPTLVINHVQDACPCCPPANVPMLVAALVNAAAVEHVALFGGTVSANPCDDVAGPHGWGGLWPLVMDTIVGWTNGHKNLLQAPPATSPDLNQHGLTGSWYEPATSGQGFAVQIIPNQSPGNGLAFVSWFTFDTVIGGAEHQRWYTLQGPVVTGQPSASLTIYQNTGGNFNAPPATNPQAVGTATLSFATCSSGSLSYTFTDGSGRTGTVPLTRLLPNVTCSVTTPYPTNADFAFSGSWYAGAATSGQGMIAEVATNSSAFFLSWFTYMPNGANTGAAGQRWYTAQGAFTPGLRTIPVQIYETTGGKFNTPTPPGQGTVQVGSGTMTFQSCSAATFNYTFTGGSSIGSSGTIALGRVGPVPPGCTQ